MVIDALPEGVTPAMRNELKLQFAVDDSALAFSDEGNSAFETVVSVLRMLPQSGLSTKEKTGAQIISLSNEDEDGTQENPLKAEAARRVEAAGKGS